MVDDEEGVGSVRRALRRNSSSMSPRDSPQLNTLESTPEPMNTERTASNGDERSLESSEKVMKHLQEEEERLMAALQMISDPVEEKNEICRSINDDSNDPLESNGESIDGILPLNVHTLSSVKVESPVTPDPGTKVSDDLPSPCASDSDDSSFNISWEGNDLVLNEPTHDVPEDDIAIEDALTNGVNDVHIDEQELPTDDIEHKEEVHEPKKSKKEKKIKKIFVVPSGEAFNASILDNTIKNSIVDQTEDEREGDVTDLFTSDINLHVDSNSESTKNNDKSEDRSPDTVSQPLNEESPTVNPLNQPPSRLTHDEDELILNHSPELTEHHLAVASIGLEMGEVGSRPDIVSPPSPSSDIVGEENREKVMVSDTIDPGAENYTLRSQPNLQPNQDIAQTDQSQEVYKQSEDTSCTQKESEMNEESEADEESIPLISFETSSAGKDESDRTNGVEDDDRQNDNESHNCPDINVSVGNDEELLITPKGRRRGSILKLPSDPRSTSPQLRRVSFNTAHSLLVYDEDGSKETTKKDNDADQNEDYDTFDDSGSTSPPPPPPPPTSPSLRSFSADPLQPKFRRKTTCNARFIYYPYEELRSTYPEDIDITKKELYLTDEEFLQLFGMTKDEYKILPKWKAERLKRNLGLF